MSASDYGREMGTDALDRQTAEGLERFVCCGEPRQDGHHPLCRHYEPPAVPELIDGQETLL